MSEKDKSGKDELSLYAKVTEELLRDVDLVFEFKSTEYGKRMEKVIEKYKGNIDNWLNEKKD